MSSSDGKIEGHSAACCTVPPVTGDKYEAKGSYEELGGMKTYVTGPKDATKAILVIMDIFGFYPQTLQGCDILGQTYRVFLPDPFDGKPADIAWYPPQTDEHKSKLGEFFQTQAAPPKTLERIPKLLSDAKEKNPKIDSWGIHGYCWGGKIVSLSTGEGTKFKAGSQAHPAMLSGEDSAKITVPVALLPSKDESKEDVENWANAMKAPKLVKWYDDQPHGWMAARADLNDKRNNEQYRDGYQTLLEWYHKYL